MTSESVASASAAAERINASMDQVNLSDDENSPQRRANIRGKHFSEKPFLFVFLDISIYLFKTINEI